MGPRPQEPARCLATPDLFSADVARRSADYQAALEHLRAVKQRAVMAWDAWEVARNQWRKVEAEFDRKYNTDGGALYGQQIP